MKTHILTLFAAAFFATSCGSMATLSNGSSAQRFTDGVYSRPSVSAREARTQTESSTAALVGQTKSSEVYLRSGAGVDTLIIPKNKSARFKYNKVDSTLTFSLLDDSKLYSGNNYYNFNYSFAPAYAYYGYRSPYFYDYWYSQYYDYGYAWTYPW